MAAGIRSHLFVRPSTYAFQLVESGIHLFHGAIGATVRYSNGLIAMFATEEQNVHEFASRHSTTSQPGEAQDSGHFHFIYLL